MSSNQDKETKSESYEKGSTTPPNRDSNTNKNSPIDPAPQYHVAIATRYQTDRSAIAEILILVYEFNRARTPGYLYEISEILRAYKINATNFKRDIEHFSICTLLYGVGELSFAEAMSARNELFQITGKEATSIASLTITDSVITPERLLLVKNGLRWQYKYGSLPLPKMGEARIFVMVCCMMYEKMGGLREETEHHVVVISEALAGSHRQEAMKEQAGVFQKLELIERAAEEALNRVRNRRS